MPADALHYKFAADELNERLEGGRIEKIQAVSPDTVMFSVRKTADAKFLIISVNPASAACFAAKEKAAINTELTPRFLPLFKRKLTGGRIRSVETVPGERIVIFTIDSRNELGDVCEFRLIAELMGKHSNLILVEKSEKIVECVKTVSADMSSKRQVLPGLSYCPAPPQGKADPQNPEKVLTVLNAFGGGNLHGYLLSSLSGLSPVSVSEALFLAFGNSVPTALSSENLQRLAGKITGLFDQNALAPCYSDSDFFIRPYKHIAAVLSPANSLCEAMSAVYRQKETAGAIAIKTIRLQSAVKSALTKAEKKLGILLDQLRACETAETDRIKGELLTANLYRIADGAGTVTVENYYADPAVEIVIELDGKLSPAQNAQAFFKRYQKSKKTAEAVAPQIETVKADTEYLSGVLKFIRSAETIADLDEIAEELMSVGILKDGKKQSGKHKRTEQYRLSGVKRSEFEGYLILSGRNNMQNDALLKESAPNDLWLHTKDIHGSHTVVVNPKKTLPPENVIRRAAALTALYSKANESENVPVDYTFVKFVHKPKSAAPGKVVYTNQKTVFVMPGK